MSVWSQGVSVVRHHRVAPGEHTVEALLILHSALVFAFSFAVVVDSASGPAFAAGVDGGRAPVVVANCNSSKASCKHWV